MVIPCEPSLPLLTHQTALVARRSLPTDGITAGGGVVYSRRVQGLVGYPSSDGDYGDGYSLALALTVAGQRHLLPVDAATLARNPCIEERYSMLYDLRTIPAVKAGSEPLCSNTASGILTPASASRTSASNASVMTCLYCGLDHHLLTWF